jgi:hypothetical protein
LVRQRDFDEPFFFAGASQEQTNRFLADGGKRGMQFRQHGVLWSAAIGASTQRCIAQLTRLYDRALRHHAHSVALGTADLAADLFPFCDRGILLAGRGREMETTSSNPPHYPRCREISLESAEVWEQVLGIVGAR